ncbi:MAG: epoxide hydrolase [Leptolyngbyaceae cyanobacterium MO_188.B28]|nr:epoxide hydrolase [Leptolyngbyaceae cyanobacterium MO_188.B28]
MSSIQSFRIDFPQNEIDDLMRRLQSTRWPEAETPDDWSQGVPLAYIQALWAYWMDDYDWRGAEELLNSFPNYTMNIDGLDIHFIHLQSASEQAKPLIITHGWPGSVLEFYKIIEQFADPAVHGGDAADAFHVVCPSLPGYGFSGKPSAPGWGVEKIAEAWDKLMRRLGYESYFAQGGDWGSEVTTTIGIQNKGHCKGIHVNMPLALPTQKALETPDDADKKALMRLKYYQQWDAGYSKQQSTRPQTVGYGLVDSPIGLAAWIVEKFWAWTDCNGHPENALTKDEMLGDIMLYWLTAAGASSARLYWESFEKVFSFNTRDKVVIPAGGSIFPHEIIPTPRSWAEQRYRNLVYWNELDRGGHFAAFEQPDLFVEELRVCFRKMR